MSRKIDIRCKNYGTNCIPNTSVTIGMEIPTASWLWMKIQIIKTQNQLGSDNDVTTTPSVASAQQTNYESPIFAMAKRFNGLCGWTNQDNWTSSLALIVWWLFRWDLPLHWSNYRLNFAHLQHHYISTCCRSLKRRPIINGVYHVYFFISVQRLQTFNLSIRKMSVKRTKMYILRWHHSCTMLIGK